MTQGGCFSIKCGKTFPRKVACVRGDRHGTVLLLLVDRFETVVVSYDVKLANQVQVMLPRLANQAHKVLPR